MKRFLIKFLILFAVIFGNMGIYGLYIKPNISGDSGVVGQIPFGHEYIDSIRSAQPSSTFPIALYNSDEAITDSVLTIGDSFSQQGEYGYSRYMAEQLHCGVLNVHKHLHVPEHTFIQLVNAHRIPEGTLVIVESAERIVIKRLSSLDFTDATPFVVPPADAEQTSRDDLLSGTIMWMMKSAGIKQPVHAFRLTDELFSHPTIHHTVYIYDSPWDNDGDFRFSGLSPADYDAAWINLYQLKQFADAHHIRLIYLVAADKYDVYEPFIVDAPVHNPTLDNIPQESWIINSKSILQQAVYAGVKDVYYLNDTHWSPVGGELVGTELAERIRKLSVSEN